MFTRLKLTTDQARLAVIGGVSVLAFGAIGATAAIGAGVGRAAPAEADVAPAGARLLTIQTSAPPPLVMPAAPAEGDRMAVLADAPADLSYDADLRGSLDVAALRAQDAAEAQRSAKITASWEREAASLQAQIDAAGRPAYDPIAAEPRKNADADITAAAGDTRAAASAE